MDQAHYEKMRGNLERLLESGKLRGRAVYLFGHCNASEQLIGLLSENGLRTEGILDNNRSKHGFRYRGIPVLPPGALMEDKGRTIVCIVARAAASMERQLREMGYPGPVERLVEYDSYAEYSLSAKTVAGKQERLQRGLHLLGRQRERYPGFFRLYCPFAALGDVYYMMAYLPYFLDKRGIRRYVVFTVGDRCAEVVRMFGGEHVEPLCQRDMDESVQAVLYTGDGSAYIPHQDRPYAIKLARALYVKRIPLEMLYKCGVFGLRQDCVPCRPVKLETYGALERVRPGKAVILSPYAKSVTNIPQEYWTQIVGYYREKGYQVFTNTAEGEQALEGTLRLQARLSEMQSVAERAGTFIGIRSGLCDVLKNANCKKLALYPDCCYSDTRWKMEEIYHLDGFQNIVVR